MTFLGAPRRISAYYLPFPGFGIAVTADTRMM
jgi:hypothetical protein